MKWLKIALVIVLVTCIAMGLYVARDSFNNEKINVNEENETLPPWTPMNIIVEGGEVKIVDEDTLPAEEEIPSEYEGDEELFYIDELNPEFVLPEDFS